jgi:hypothetical protein
LAATSFVAPVDKARAIPLPDDREILHPLPQDSFSTTRPEE